MRFRPGLTNGSAVDRARLVAERRGPTSIFVDPGQLQLGIKKRDGRKGVEVKGLVAIRETSPAPFAGRPQIWCKWTSEGLTIDHLPRVAVHKTRWLRKYDTSGGGVAEVELDTRERPRDSPHRLLERGCQLELVALRLEDDGGAWWSLGFEAFGEIATVEEEPPSDRRPPAWSADLEAGLELSYPAWLASGRL